MLAKFDKEVFNSPLRNPQNQGVPAAAFTFASNTLARKRLGRQITEEYDAASHIPLHRKINLKRINSSPTKLKSNTVHKRQAIAAAAATAVDMTAYITAANSN